jgi:hypothetical protein
MSRHSQNVYLTPNQRDMLARAVNEQIKLHQQYLKTDITGERVACAEASATRIADWKEIARVLAAARDGK